MYEVVIWFSDTNNENCWFRYETESKENANRDASYIIECGYYNNDKTGLYIPLHRIITIEVEEVKKEEE